MDDLSHPMAKLNFKLPHVLVDTPDSFDLWKFSLQTTLEEYGCRDSSSKKPSATLPRNKIEMNLSEQFQRRLISVEPATAASY